MTTLQSIQSAHSAELCRLNEHISRQLASTNALMRDVVEQQLRTKGKQIRPLLVMLCAEFSGQINEKTISAAAAVELIHNASLIHDDVVDNSPTRRGRPTVNAVWDNHIAVLVGDFYTSSAMQEAIRTGDLRIVESLCKLGRQLSLGEIDQIFHARSHSATVQAYFDIIDYKTASLFVSSAQMGCLSVDADERQTQALMTYARALGRCFQIRDDIFDYFPSETVGKPTGNDLQEGKVSLPLLLAMDKCPEDRKAQVQALLERDQLTDAEIDTLMSFAREFGGIELAYETMEQLRREAVEALSIFPDSPIHRELDELMDFIIARNF